MAWYDQVHTTKRARLLTERKDVTGRQYIYLQGVASVVAGSAVTFDELGVTALVDTDTAATITGPMAVATAAVDATTEYGWFGIVGDFTCKAADAVADNAAVYATSTAGTLDDAAASIGRVYGAVWRSINDSVAGTATIQLWRPWLGADLST